MPVVATKPMAGQKVMAYVKIAQENEKFWAAVLVFFGTLFLLGTVPFYPVYILPLLALLCGAVAYKHQPIAVILGMLLALPAISFQSAVFGWVFLLLLAVAMFEVWENWMVIACLEVLVLAPFSFPDFPIFGWITILGMAIAAMHFGSKKSIMISVPSVLLILMLTSLWLAPNSAYMPIRTDIYKPGYQPLMLTRPASDLMSLPTAFSTALSSMIKPTVMAETNNAIAQVVKNASLLLFSDSCILQIITWGIALWLMSYLSGRIKRRPQLISSFALLSVLPFYYVIAKFSGEGFPFGLATAIGASIAVLGAMEQLGLHISREKEAQSKEQLRSFGKFGFKDMSVGGAEQSMDDVGGYEDVKQELRDSILMPLENKELAYAYNIKPPSGILLFGPPGTGKTMLMRALAREIGYLFIEIKTTEIISQWLGESEKNIKEAFDDARKSGKPTILFFDEIDAIGKKREAYSSDDVAPRVLSTLLTEMDGATKTKVPLLVIGATNLPGQLDTALLRPGRLDKIIYMHLPDRKAREAIFRVDLKKLPYDKDVDFDRLAQKTERFSGADIKNIVNEAVKLASKDAMKASAIVPINMNHLMTVVSALKPSTSLAALDQYEQFQLDFERRVGGEKAEKPAEEVVKWEDVVGLDEVKKALLETIEVPLLHEDLMKEMKIKPSKGILLFGPPGTGKTLIVKAACNELKASFQSLSGAEIMKRGYTQAVSVIKETFNRGRENTPAIIFIDEIETFAPARGVTSSEIVGQFLTEMDGLKELKGVVVMAATNKPGLLDPALLRPGRFDKIFYIPPPDRKGRVAMFRLYLGKFASGMDLDALSDAAPGFSGADIALVCRDAKMVVLRGRISGQEGKLTTESVLSLLRKRKPSITKGMLAEYDDFVAVYGERGEGEGD
jgi:transitional endoplasmic reticulum ATPase